MAEPIDDVQDMVWNNWTDKERADWLRQRLNEVRNTIRLDVIPKLVRLAQRLDPPSP